MELRNISLFLLGMAAIGSLILVSTGCQSQNKTIRSAVYAGVKDYGTVVADNKDVFTHIFHVDGKDLEYSVATDNNYEVQNQLQEGYIYDLAVEGTTITGVTILDNRQDDINYIPPVQGEAGKRTLRNYLATALEPVGTTLYVYGGAWDWQDNASSNQAMTIGLPRSWIEFYNDQDADYNYKNEDAANSYYPFNGWNQYYYAGADCSGYIGWVLYNTFETASSTVTESVGYVMPAKRIGAALADRGWGTVASTIDASAFRPGDIFCMKGHVWTVIGSCQDGSIVIAHSTPTDSKTGNPGGGVQLSALNPASDTDTNCEAYQLAVHYMETYYPEWSSRYDAVLKPYSQYTECAEEPTGRFSWNLDGDGISDPDGFSNMSADEILVALYGYDD